MFCTNCGAQIPEGALFCPRCGSRAATSFGEDQDKTFAEPWEDIYGDRGSSTPDRGTPSGSSGFRSGGSIGSRSGESGGSRAGESGGLRSGESRGYGSSGGSGSEGRATSSTGGRLRFGSGFEKSGFQKDEDYGHGYSRPSSDDRREEFTPPSDDTYHAASGGGLFGPDPERETGKDLHGSSAGPAGGAAGYTGGGIGGGAGIGGSAGRGTGPAGGGMGRGAGPAGGGTGRGTGFTAGSAGGSRPAREPAGGAEKWVVTGLGIIGLTGLIRVLLWVVVRILFFILSRTYMYSLVPFLNFLTLMQRVVNIAILVLCVAALGGAVWLIIQRRPEDRQMPAVGAAAAILLGASCVGRIFYIPFWITVVLLIAAIVVGIDLCLNVFAEKNDLRGPFRLGDDLEVAGNFFRKEEKVDPKMYTDREIPRYETTPEHEAKDSYFDGTGLQLFGQTLLMLLLTVFTCGIGAPWGFVRMRRWVVSHTVIEGKRQTFNGTGGQMFGLYIKWALLTVITCGIYLWFAMVDYMKWETKHTSYEGGSAPLDGAYPYSAFDGGVGEFFGNSLMCGLLTVFTCGIGAPWGLTTLYKWSTRSTVIEGERYFYDGTGGELFGLYLTNALLTIITCGIYSPWAVCRMNRYIINHTHVDATYRYH